MNAAILPSSRHLGQARRSSFYIQLREQVLDSLMDEGKPGDRVPSERQLAKQFETSTVTIARILQEFQENGLCAKVLDYRRTISFALCSVLTADAR